MSQYPISLDIPLDIPTKYCNVFTSRQEDLTRHHRILTMFYRRSDTPASIAENARPLHFTNDPLCYAENTAASYPLCCENTASRLYCINYASRATASHEP